MEKKQKQVIGNYSTGIQVENISLNINVEKSALYELILNLIENTKSNKFENIKISEISEILKISNIVSEPPLIPNKISYRKKLIDNIYEKLKKLTWIGIYGEKGTGKTYITLLLNKKFTGNKYWISFKDIKNELSDLYLDEVIKSHFGEEVPKKNIYDYFSVILKKTPKNSIFILDDLPELLLNFPLTQKLIYFAKVCAENGIKIISTSFYNFHSDFVYSLGENEINTFSPPPFCKDEISELFNMHNAKTEIINNNVLEFILTITKGNPILISSLIKYLEKKDWKYDLNIFNDLIMDKYAKDEKKQYFLIFSRTVIEEIKDLVYRLDLINRKFSYKEILLVSEVEPKIKNPYDKLGFVLNVWIQQTEDMFELSPLIKGIGFFNLDFTIAKNIFISLANNIISKKFLNQNEVSQVIVYYIKAKEYNLAALLLKDILIEFLKIENRKFEDWGISYIWANQALPEEIDLDLRLIIRSLQLKINQKLNRKSDFILEDTKKLIREASKDEIYGVMIISFVLATERIDNKDQLFYSCFIKTLQFENRNDLLNKIKNFRYEYILWLIAFEIEKPTQLIQWINTIDKMPVESKKIFFESKEFTEKISLIFDNVYLNEYHKTSNEQDWDKFLKYIEKYENKLKKMNIEIFWCLLKRLQILILAEHIKDFDKSMKVARNSLENFSKNPIIQFIIKGIIARENLFNKRFEESDKWFTDAFKENINSLFSEKILGFLWQAEAVSHFDLDKAIKICKEGISFYNKNKKNINESFLLMSYGELIILIFRKFGFSKTFKAYEKGIELLWSSKQKDNTWKKLFVLFGHISGYLSAMACSGSPPSGTENGKIYTPPTTGMFINMSDELISLYKSDNDFLLPTQVAIFAEDIGNDEKALKWALIAYKVLPKNNYFLIYPIIIKILIPNLILNKEFKKAIVMSYEFFLKKPDFVERSISNSYKDKIFEDHILYSTIIPIMLNYGILKIQNLINKNEIDSLVQKISNISFENINNGSRVKSDIEKVFKISLFEDFSHNNVIELGKKYQKEDRKGFTLLCFIGAILKDNISIEDSIQLQEKFIEFIQKQYSKSLKFIYRNIIIRFFITYWENVIKINKTKFKYTKTLLKKIKNNFDSQNEHSLVKTFIMVKDNLIK